MTFLVVSLGKKQQLNHNGGMKAVNRNCVLYQFSVCCIATFFGFFFFESCRQAK